MEMTPERHENLSKNQLLNLLENQGKSISKLESEKEYLSFQLAQLQRMLFGSKRERFISAENPNQLELPLGIDNKEVDKAVDELKEQISYERQKGEKKPHPGRLPLPSHLPVKEIILEPSENVEGMKYIGDEITDELEYKPGKLYINRYIRKKYITKENQEGKQEAKIASLDFRPIDKCIAGTNLLAQIVIDKFVDHLPVYRQLQRFSREGVEINSSTIESWQRLLAQLLYPLYECHKQYTVRSGYLQTDESPIKVQDKDKKGATHSGYMWVYHNPVEQSVYFDYSKGRSSANPSELLAHFEGYLQTDGYGVYDQFGKRTTITHLACWAHLRRMFEKALDYDCHEATIILTLIQQLYAIERQAKNDKLDTKARNALRLDKSLPIINELGKIIAASTKNTLPKSPLGKAYLYAIKRWDTFSNYLKDGNLEIDNNLIENAIRPLALGRKNYLFAGSHHAAMNIAMYYSFFGTCKKHNINPRKWLVYVLKNIKETKTSQLREILPQFIDRNLIEEM